VQWYKASKIPPNQRKSFEQAWNQIMVGSAEDTL
jgi:hypothetical protein